MHSVILTELGIAIFDNRLGAILGSASAADEGAISEYGMHLGTAFQLIDDVLDYSGDYQETGKNLGDDLAEGKPTLPLIYAMRQGTADQAKIIRNAIEQGGIQEFQLVVQTMHDTGALEYTRNQARAESNCACAAISALPNTNYKQSLLQLADFAVTRNY